MAVGPYPYSRPIDLRYPSCSGMCERALLVKSVAESKSVTNSLGEGVAGGGTATELTGGAPLGMAVVVVEGVVDANRMAAAFSIITFDLGSIKVLRIEA